MATLSKQAKDILVLLVLYFVSRLVWLTRYPIFNDEAIYLRYGLVMLTVPNQFWYSLSDSGKQPLMYWLYGVAMQVFRDPLFAGRLITVLIASATPVACYLIGRAIGSRRTAIVAGLIAVVSPLSVFFDRLALVDSVLMALFAWVLVLLQKINKQNALVSATVIGLLVGISLWVKSTGYIIGGIALLGIVYRLYTYRFSLLPGSLVVFWGTVLLIFLPLFMRSEYIHSVEMAHEYTYTLFEVLSRGFAHVPGNILNMILVYGGYVSPAAVWSIAALFRKRTPQQTTLIGAWILSVMAIVVFGRSVHGRYVLFTSVPILALTAFAFDKKPWVSALTLAVMTTLSTFLIINPAAFFHWYPQWQVFATETFQYVDGWPSGYGVAEAIDAVDNDRQGAPAIIATRWDSGNPEDAVFVYAPRYDGLKRGVMDVRLPEETSVVLQAAKTMPVYFVTRKGQYGGFEQVLTRVAQLPKPYGAETVEVFRVTSNSFPESDTKQDNQIPGIR